MNKKNKNNLISKIALIGAAGISLLTNFLPKSTNSKEKTNIFNINNKMMTEIFENQITKEQLASYLKGYVSNGDGTATKTINALKKSKTVNGKKINVYKAPNGFELKGDKAIHTITIPSHIPKGYVLNGDGTATITVDLSTKKVIKNGQVIPAYYGLPNYYKIEGNKAYHSIYLTDNIAREKSEFNNNITKTIDIYTSKSDKNINLNYNVKEINLHIENESKIYITNIQSLKRIHISSSLDKKIMFNEENFSFLKQCKNLEEIEFDNVEIDPQFLEQFSNLRKIIFNGHTFFNCTINFAKFPNLEYVSFGYEPYCNIMNFITDESIDYFNKKNITIHSNTNESNLMILNKEEAKPNWMHIYSTNKKIDLPDTVEAIYLNIDENQELDIENIKNIKEVHIYSSFKKKLQVNEKNFGFLKKCKNLEVIAFNNVNVDSNFVEQLTELKEIYFHHRTFFDSNINFTKFPNLNRVHFGYEPNIISFLTDESIAYLKNKGVQTTSDIIELNANEQVIDKLINKLLANRNTNDIYSSNTTLNKEEFNLYLDTEEKINLTNIQNIKKINIISSAPHQIIFNEENFAALKQCNNLEYISFNNVEVDPKFLEQFNCLKNISFEDNTFFNCLVDFTKFPNLEYVYFGNILNYDIATFLTSESIQYFKEKKVILDSYYCQNNSILILNSLLKINTELKKITDQLNVTKDSKDIEKLDAILAYIVGNLEYSNLFSKLTEQEQESHREFVYRDGYLDGALNNPTEVLCGNYTALFQALATRLDLESYFVISKDHGWNLVNINGNYAYTDATWVDSENTIKTLTGQLTADMAIEMGQGKKFQWYLKNPNRYYNDSHVPMNHSYNIELSLKEKISNNYIDWKYEIKLFNDKTHLIDFATLCAIIVFIKEVNRKKTRSINANELEKSINENNNRKL